MDSCTALLVTHEDGHRACTDDTCWSPDPVRHDWRTACHDLDEPCHDCIVTVVPARRSQAA